jgi:anti-sigma factor RsiW
MNCPQAQPLIEAYADGELEAAAVLELQRHFQGCATCAGEWRRLQALKKSLKQDAFYFPAPDAFRRAVKAGLRAQVRTPSWWSQWNWLTTASTGLAVAGLTLLLTLTATRPSARQQLEQEVVSSHIRSLMASHALDVVSTDQHTVKPWFNGKLDFSPPVRDLAAQGYPLTGGRLDYLQGRSVAALVFQRHRHVINLFIWPTPDADASPAPLPARQGYHLIRWSQGGMDFWAVSDVNEPELLEFARDFTAGE